MAPPVLHVSLIVGGDLQDLDGGKLGRVEDLILRLGDDDYPSLLAFATVASTSAPSLLLLGVTVASRR